jgi:CO dehydrogenase maturation factor
MMVVVEPTRKSFETALRIRKLAVQMEIQNILLVGSKLLDETDENAIRTFAKKNEFQILGLIHYDSAVHEADLLGASLFLSFPSANALQEIKKMSDRLDVMIKK